MVLKDYQRRTLDAVRDWLVTLADRADRLVILAFPRGDGAAAVGADERLAAHERGDGWRLRAAFRRSKRIALQASLATLARPFVPCAVEWRGRPLPPDAWRFDPATGVLRAAFTGRRGTLLVRARCAAAGR